MKKLTAHGVARAMDPSVLKFDTTFDMVKDMIDACLKYDFGCCFEMPCFYEYASERLKGTNTEFGTSLNFPSGQGTTDMKVFEARYFVSLGAQQVDMVMNVGWLKQGWYDKVAADIKAVRDATAKTSLKVIIEAMLLTDQQITDASKIVMDCGADFVKSGTGFQDKPTTLHHVRTMKAAVGNKCRVKVAGGVRDLKTLMEMYDAGAERFGIGFASSLKIYEEACKFDGEFDATMITTPQMAAQGGKY